MSALRALLAVLAFMLGGEACAHATLVSAAPPDGAVLAAPPDEIVLRFDEPVSILVVRLLDDTGAAVVLPSTPRAEGRTLHVELPPRMREGTYLLSYRVTSADSHPVGGSIAFSIGRASWRVQTEDTLSGLSPWRIALRAFRDAALLIAAGSALFVLLVSPFPGERPVLVVAGFAAAVFSAAGIGVQGAALIGHGEILAPESWLIALRTTYGWSAIIAAVASLMIAHAASLARGRLRTVLLATGALAAAASLPLTGHAAASPAALARYAVGAHALAAAFWAGSLIALYALVTRGSGEAVEPLRRFSRIAMVVVAALIAAGAAFAVMQLGSPADLVYTRYGNLVLAKSALVAALVALAARNRLVLLPSLERGASGAARALRRAIAAELVLVAVVVALTAILVQTPPRTASIEEVLTAGSRTALITITPGRPGPNEISVVFRDVQGIPFDPAEALLAFSNAGAGVEAIERPLQRAAPGIYRHHGSELGFPGSWRLEIRARIDDFESVSLSTVVEIR